MAEEKTGLVQGFKEFVMRGNVIDLAVAVVVGTAFAAVVKSVVDNLVNPAVAALGGDNAIGLGFQITDNPNTFVNVGAVISALITFLLTMLVVYFVFVVPMNKARSLSRKEPEAEDVPDDVLLLREIRDLLANQRGGAISNESRPDA
ncbi:MAG: large conductance mechanosensitive channel protein MscL [Candidatus Nanopelagicales bacterium]|jgi:large conductance mechanosensitive channel|nr:large conductance mechanosensitive channel protein MscL [Candidatus Nanopelagicales bacterium]